MLVGKWNGKGFPIRLHILDNLSDNRTGHIVKKCTPRHSSLIPDRYPISVQVPLHLVNKYYPQTQETFPQKLRAARIAMGLYQKDFARRLAVTAQTVRNWENGRGFPCRKHLKTLETLCDGVFDEDG
jgi:DNA-binding transcriptional regulator YiaG